MFWSTLPSLRASNAAVASQAPTPPTAVFVGGTAGIGEGMAVTFGEDTKGNANIIIVGRNRAAAEKILAGLPLPQISSATDTKVVREFVECDVMSMKNVEQATQRILTKHKTVNYLILTAGIVAVQGYTPTSEGIDSKLALHYYARWKFIRDLLPALTNAKESGGEAKVLSVLAAGYGGPIDVEDFELRRLAAFSMKRAMAAPTYNDLMMQKFASLNPSLTFIQSTPGGVNTSIFASSPTLTLRTIRWIVLPLLSPFTKSPRDCGAYMWNGIYTTASKPGAWRIGAKGNDLKDWRMHGDESQREKLWEHTVKIIGEAIAGE